MNIQVLTPREVPLGGPRAMTVRRTLPSKDRSFVGAWCFVDHYGPDDVSRTGGMDVPPHPHTGLQTVSWLFEGEIEHRDSGGVHAMVRPGELNLMTAGRGISHSEVSTPATRVLHGLQLWVALPEPERDAARDFQHHVPDLVTVPGASARVFVGSLPGLDGAASPVRTATPLLGAEILLEPGTAWELATQESFEHAILVDRGNVTIDGQPVARGELGVRDAGADRMVLAHPASCGPDGGVPARVVLLGGEPFEEAIVMWWNFVGRTHEDIVQYRAQWQAQDERFGRVEGYEGSEGHVSRLGAPELPHVRLRPRGRMGMSNRLADVSRSHGGEHDRGVRAHRK
ncbi:MAG: pirin family protein [Dermatophilaceae bacterium]